MQPLPLLSEPVPAYGEAQPVAPGVRRIVARNPGPYTYHGTNTWIVGEGRVAVIDPGPDDPAHRRAVLEALRGETVTHILITHGHQDHAQGAAALAAETGAALHGFAAAWRERASGTAAAQPAFRWEVPLADGDRIDGEGWALEVLHTPGHASDHLCFALQGSGILFSGDHVMGWSSTLVAPPDGDMAAYMASLARLLRRADTLYLCGHGPPIERPERFVRALLAHREGREAQILEALRAGDRTADDLLARLYPGLAEPLARAARRTIEAHLAKLAAEGRLP